MHNASKVFRFLTFNIVQSQGSDQNSLDTFMFISQIKTKFLISIFLILLNTFSLIYAQSEEISFEKISTEQGLSEGSIYAILQDSKGFLWFGTKDGLNKYDGYNFKYYKSDSFDSTSISDNHIYSIIEDKSKTIWVGTFNGLNKFDPISNQFVRYTNDLENPNSISGDRIRALLEDRSGTIWIGTDDGLNMIDPVEFQQKESIVFQHFVFEPENKNSLSDNKISCLYEDETGMIWIGTKEGGLNKFDRKNNKFYHYKNDPSIRTSISNDEVLSLYEDRFGFMWVGTADGLNKLVSEKSNHSDAKFIHFRSDPDDPNSLSSSEIRSIYEDKNSELWIGTKGGGINIYDRASEGFKRYKHDNEDPNSISDNRIQPIYGDQSGLIWIGTKGGGLNKVNLNRKRFVHYSHDPDNSNSLSDNQVYSIYEDNSGNLWIGTEGGLNKLNQISNKFFHYKHDPQKNSITNDRIWAICEDTHDNIWLGLKSGGLNCLNRKTGLITHFLPDATDSNSVSDDIVVSLCLDHEGIIWIGTYNGLDKLETFNGNLANVRFTHYRNDPEDPNSISNDRIISILEDRNNTLWIGTYIGLNKFDSQTGKFVRYINDPTNPNSLSDNRIWSIFEENNDILWLGTNGGLNKFDKINEEFTHYTVEDGLQNNVVYGIVNDNEGNLWLSTNGGISKFDVHQETFINYNIKDGLQGNEFNPGAYSKSKSEELFFGGKNGLNKFNPNKIKSNPHIPPVVLTTFYIFNKEVNLDTSITEKKLLELSYKKNFISFEFAALDYTFPGKNQYAYKLEGFDEEWITSGNRRYASYTNLDGGEYIFRVCGSNNDGIWNEEGSSLKIIIHPPFWQTLWFRVLTVLFIVSLAIIIYRSRINIMKKQNQKLEIMVNEKTEELVEKYKESENIMENVDEGLFLLNEGFEIGSQYSNIFEKIMNEKELSHKNFVELFQKKLPDKEISAIEMYLNLMFENEIDQETLDELNPLSKVKVNFNGGKKLSTSKYLDFKFRKVSDFEKKKNLFSTVRDITEQVKLSEKLEESQKQSKKQIELLMSILHVEPSMLQEFINSVQNEIANIKDIFKTGKKVDYPEMLKKIYRSMHLIKGNASLLDLKVFVEKAHEFEENISNIQENVKINASDIKVLDDKLEEIRITLEGVNDLIERMSGIHNQFRPKRQFENELLLRSINNLVEQLSKDYSKEIKLDHEKFSGSDIPYHLRLLVKELLIQLIRNSVAHGIESPEERKKQNKKTCGKIEISTSTSDKIFVLRVRDDGGGIQIEKLKKNALESGKWDLEEINTWNEDKVVESIFTPGISTTTNADFVSGRGVGMDIVKQKLIEHSGRIKTYFSAGQFCEFIISLPKKSDESE